MTAFSRQHPRLLIASCVGIAMFAVLRPERNVLTAALVGWNAGCWSWNALMAAMMTRRNAGDIRRFAVQEDVGAWLALVFICTSAVVSVAAIVFELAHVGPRLYSPFHYLL